MRRTVHRAVRVGPFVLAIAALGGCAAFDSAQSPDVIYSETSGEAIALQVPPDLTDVSDAQQFVLPGATGAPIARNTLLPSIEGVRFERGGEQSWLAFDLAPEALWPELLSFVAARGYAIDRTSPVSGTLATRWQPVDDAEDGVLGGLIGGPRDPRARIAFRLERDGTNGARLFARRQVAAGRLVEAGSVTDWPAASADPEATDTLLALLLVHLGLQRQQSEGVLDSLTAADVLDDAVVRTGAAGSQLVVHRGYLSAFEALGTALVDSGWRVDSRDDSVGRIAFAGAPGTAVQSSPDADADADGGALVLTVEPVHVAAVRVGVVDADGRRLAAARERQVLDTLAMRLLEVARSRSV